MSSSGMSSRDFSGILRVQGAVPDFLLPAVPDNRGSGIRLLDSIISTRSLGISRKEGMDCMVISMRASSA